MEIANAVEALQNGRIFIELINGAFLFELEPRRPNMTLASNSRLIAHGSGSTRAAPM
jgi:hypothetical protein